MRAMIIEEFGGEEKIKSVDVPKPQPQDNEILVKIAYAGVNPVDWKIREGMIEQLLPHVFPIILGWDMAGTVESIGSKVSSYKVGDKVYGYCRKPQVQHGCYAEYITVDEEAIALLPEKLNFAEAAGIPLVGLTAWQCLFDFANLQAGETVLIHAGAGGIGSLAIQFAKHKGAKVYTTASAKNHEYVKNLGADYVIDYNTSDFVDVILQEEPQKLNVVYDTVGGETQQKSAALIKEGGTLVSIVSPPDESLAPNIKSGFVFVSPNAKQLKEISNLIKEDKVQIPAITEMKLEEAAEALRINREGHVRGKLVLKV
ncbi:NADP-dependent oxidoreductase [Candidatus Uabimicrobium sp. HlEnr_7]|uniref:NADP-dependent oxidoreductase n=1 Tax=Candidatus Uabimicrobium helgolandensis TaxID=3095367 RepID=UPI0035589447